MLCLYILSPSSGCSMRVTISSMFRNMQRWFLYYAQNGLQWTGRGTGHFQEMLCIGCCVLFMGAFLRSRFMQPVELFWTMKAESTSCMLGVVHALCPPQSRTLMRSRN